MQRETYEEAVQRARACLQRELTSENHTELLHMSAGLERVCNFYTARYLADTGDAYVRDRLNTCVLEYTHVQARLAELRAVAYSAVTSADTH